MIKYLLTLSVISISIITVAQTLSDDGKEFTGTFHKSDFLFGIDGTTANNENKTTDLPIQLFPNPAKESINIIVAKDATIEIFNALGMHIETIRASAFKTIVVTTSKYDNGVYLLKTDSGLMQRFVVKH